jgi:hypothetical protein
MTVNFRIADNNFFVNVNGKTYTYGLDFDNAENFNSELSNFLSDLRQKNTSRLYLSNGVVLSVYNSSFLQIACEFPTSSKDRPLGIEAILTSSDISNLTNCLSKIMAIEYC